ncbi:hypothetical protein L596_013287 [Steinernema carpocapsae]|uniref:Uncharacterized protein n=1 Tax=Steinernema carpocapsae TaxID=34508 RepID=A0A4U5P0J1_STECR|nr:hypothetical protein L596_013287 [Steinernema carpocapsae]
MHPCILIAPLVRVLLSPCISPKLLIFPCSYLSQASPNRLHLRNHLTMAKAKKMDVDQPKKEVIVPYIVYCYNAMKQDEHQMVTADDVIQFICKKERCFRDIVDEQDSFLTQFDLC